MNLKKEKKTLKSMAIRDGVLLSIKMLRLTKYRIMLLEAQFIGHYKKK